MEKCISQWIPCAVHIQPVDNMSIRNREGYPQIHGDNPPWFLSTFPLQDSKGLIHRVMHLHAFDALDKLPNGVIELAVLLPFLGDLVVGMDDRGMIPAAEAAADLGQRGVGELAAEIHGNLPGKSQIAGPLLGQQIVDIDLEVGGPRFPG